MGQGGRYEWGKGEKKWDKGKGWKEIEEEDENGVRVGQKCGADRT